MVRLLNISAGYAPRVALVDAATEGLDELALRERAREIAVAAQADVVSRSYCHPYALVAWSSGPVGVDIERIVRCDMEFADSISTPEEKAAGRWTTDAELISLWSSKEALAKALGDALSYDPRRLASPASWPDGSSGPWQASILPVPVGYRAWVCWRRG